MSGTTELVGLSKRHHPIPTAERCRTVITLIQFLLNRFLMSMSWLHHLPSVNDLGSTHQPLSLRIEHLVSPPNISLRRTRDSAGLPAVAGLKLDQSN